MKNLVIKTVAITFAAIIALIAVTYVCFSIFSPKTLARFWEESGNYSVSIKYYERQYSKSGDISDLADLCAKIDVKKDSARAVQYLVLLTENADFSVFCDDADKNGGYKMTSYEYYYGAYTVASYYESGIASAIIVAKKAVYSAYTANNAFFVLMAEIKTLTAADGEILVAEISGIKETLSDPAEQSFAERDITLAQSIK